MTAPTMRASKRGDLVVEEIKRWIAERRLAPGDKLPKEDELQTLFGVSKGTAREALKSLEVQGLVKVTTGPAGGATIGEVPLERAFQLLQNYLFFREMDVAQIYAVRRLLEPVLAAANPNMLLRFMCQVINHLLRHSVAMNNRPGPMAYQQLGETNVAAHKRLLEAARRGDVERVRKLMVAHI